MIHRSAQDWITVGFLALVGAGIRLVIVAGSSFPINDGGLFYAFTADLLANGMRLPQFSSYNAAGIPLVYPPLAFYLTAAAHLATGISTLHLLQFLPAIISAASIPVLFDLASLMLSSRRGALLATAVFSLIPRTFDWLIMGGGITRSLGLLFALVFLGQAFRLFAQGRHRALLPAIFAGGLVVISHPEAAMHAALGSALLLAWHRHSRHGAAQGLIVLLGIAAVTSPWWIDIASRHGADPWLAAFTAAQEDGHSILLRLFSLLRFDFTDEPFLRIFGVLGLFGLLAEISQKRYFLPAWFTLMALAEPRGGALFMMIPLAMAAAIFLDAVLLPALRSGAATELEQPARSLQTETSRPPNWPASMLQRGFLMFVFFYGVLAAYFVGHELQQKTTLTGRDQMALEWVSTQTASEDRFALVTQGEPLLDPTSDWFPAITGRRSVATFFGAEWIRNMDFAGGLTRYRALQACAEQGAQCVKDWTPLATEAVKYIYVRSPDPTRVTSLQASLGLDKDFRLRYSDEGIQIFEWLRFGAG